MIYKVINGALSQYNNAVDRTGAATHYEETLNFGSIKFVHKANTNESAFVIRLASAKFIIYAQNAPELAESIRYVRSLGFLQNMDVSDGSDSDN